MWTKSLKNISSIARRGLLAWKDNCKPEFNKGKVLKAATQNNYARPLLG